MFVCHRQHNQKSNKFQEAYLRLNLENAFFYGIKLKKYVIPFFCSFIHPSNLLYGGILLSKNEITDYLNYILNYKRDRSFVIGIVWWEPNYKYFSKVVNKYQNISIINKDFQSELFLNYLFKNKNLKINQ